MADSIYQKIVDAVIARLQTVTVANGYVTDLGNNVYDGLSHPLADDDAPTVIVNDGEQTVDDQNYGQHDKTADIELTLIASGSTAPRSVRSMASDIEKAIGTDTTWGGLAIDTNPGSVEKTEDQKELRVASATFIFSVRFRHSAWNPF